MAVAFTDLAETCAPAVAVETLAAVVSLESNFQPFDIRINADLPFGQQPKSKAEAIEATTTLMAEQHRDLQLGLGGIRIEELRKLDLTISDAFDPCLNLKATATLLDGYYRLAVRAGAAPGQAEHVMLQSYYGRSHPLVGEMAQYDEQVRREAKRLSARLASLAIAQAPDKQDAPDARSLATTSVHDSEGSQPRMAKTPSWDVFNAARRSSALVFQSDQPEQPE
ncbi:transglycosylase SLT domain-containing protein [Rhizobium jaguaris]|uniref:Type IV secretion system protein VirB1 n=1 Tax=Rhizobium jaguaris TaxID=1312183 RepID=A0A387FUK7_9HYPH|nr:transglycosylase SLT domain-containing protein [Rhizobium jaguaris]AYG62359.1 type IV secretion system protein VirB1 [Rhizobium jaguaris]